MLYREFRNKAEGVADLLNYACLVDEGVLLLKDGSFFSSFLYEGPDMNSASIYELNALTAQINGALSSLGNGWMLNVDVLRTSAEDYPANNYFPDPTSSLIDFERELAHKQVGKHFQCHYFASLTYKPPEEKAQKLNQYFVAGRENEAVDYGAVLDGFLHTTAQIEDALSASLKIKRLDSGELLSFLHRAITGLTHPVRVPEIPMFLDSVLSTQELFAGLSPRIGENYIRVIALTGYPLSSHPEVLSFLTELPLEFRWSTRFIFLDPQAANRELSKYRKHWFQKRFGLSSFIKESLNMPGQAFLDKDALAMADDANNAVSESSGMDVRFGYYTSVLVLSGESKSNIDEQARLIVKNLRHRGFTARIEEINAMEAYLGSLPGHSYQNVRRPLLHTLNLADMLPLTSIWPGLSENPNPQFLDDSPSLLHARTTGSTPFRLNLHVSDVGHTLVLGPTGAGKSTLVSLIMAQFLRYKDAQVFCFDKGRSQEVLCKAVSGVHYNICDGETEVNFYPLRDINEPNELLWAEDWLEVMLSLQGCSISPEDKDAIHKALSLLASSPSRTLTDLDIQDKKLRTALKYYTLAGSMNLLDSDNDSLQSSNFQVFELETLMNMGEKNVIPVLLYLFHQIERRLTGKPTLIVLEEAWLMLMNSVFSEKVEVWLRTLRKKNASVIFVTQSLSEIASAKNSSLIIESCPTKIYLPNPEAMNPHNSSLYKELGLTEKQIEIIANSEPKRSYYYASPLGKRLFDLGMGPVALAFCGVSSSEDLEKVKGIIKEHKELWPSVWLKEIGQSEAANYWLDIYTKEKSLKEAA